MIDRVFVSSSFYNALHDRWCLLGDVVDRIEDKLLKREVCAGLLEAKVLIEEHRNHNNQRAQSGLSYQTLVQFRRRDNGAPETKILGRS